MAERLVAADASPLIGLAAAGAFHLLRKLFGTVTVTAAVRDEVMAGGDLPGAGELRVAIREGWVKVVRMTAGELAFPELGAGEASTLALALKRGETTLVLMDESLGRARARELGITVTGLVGVLLAAKRARLAGRIRPYLDALAATNFRLSEEIVQAALAQAGER